MTAVFLIGCPHFGHDNMYKFIRTNGEKVRPYADAKEGDEIMVENWNGVVRPKDKVYVLGDVTFKENHLAIMDRLNGVKILIKGNHDTLDLKDYAKYFKDVRAYHKLGNIILSHIPIHPDSLGREFDEESGMWVNKWYNVHAHLHAECVLREGKPDPRYYSVCVERINYTPISFNMVTQEIGKRISKSKERCYDGI